MFLKTVGENEADGRIAEIYAQSRSKLGFVMSATSCWTARHDLLPIWDDFFEKVKAGFSLSPRDWRLITFIAAQQVPSTYCSMVYGKQLIEDFGSRSKILDIQRDFRAAGLGDRDVAMLAHAEAVAKDASEITQSDIDRLREAGFSDVQICDIGLCASLRCFMARFFDASGAGPEAAFVSEDSVFREALTVGRKPLSENSE